MKSKTNIQVSRRSGTLHSERLLLLMAIPIFIIAGFQVYWLNENYRKEKKNLEFRANVAFRDAIFKLQAKKLKLDKVFTDSTGEIKIEVRDGMQPTMNMPVPGPDVDMITLVNELGNRVKDSLKVTAKKSKGMVISMNKAEMAFRNDSMKEVHFIPGGGHPGNRIVQFLYGVDSLQDSIRVVEIDSAFQLALQKEKINVSFSINKKDARRGEDEWQGPGEPGKVTIGVAHPVTYELKMGNSFFYIMKRLVSPLLFSLFLVGVTILSFILLYRNILRQQKLAVIKNEFISNITHELKTPIATVGVAIEALRNFNAINDPQRTKEYLDISQNELHRLSLLVDKVLKLSMFEKKEIELKYENINLKDVVEEVVSSMRLQIEKNHAKVSVVTEGDLNLQADRLHLLSVVFNLLDNALKYSNGEPAILVELKEEGDTVQMTVKDNGIGIAQEYQDKLFEKFFRVPAGDTHNAKGYGLGLSYVSHVVKKHKGTIAVDSQPGIGTRFIITLPKQST